MSLWIACHSNGHSGAHPHTGNHVNVRQRLAPPGIWSVGSGVCGRRFPFKLETAFPGKPFHQSCYATGTNHPIAGEAPNRTFAMGPTLRRSFRPKGRILSLSRNRAFDFLRDACSAAIRATSARDNDRRTSLQRA